MNLILFCLIGILLCIIGIFLASHDDFARADLATKKLENMASSTKDCFNLQLMADNHQNDWFPDNYVKIAEKRLNELNCK